MRVATRTEFRQQAAWRSGRGGLVSMKRAFALACVALVVATVTLGASRWWHGDQTSLPTQVAEHTTFVDLLELRGELRPAVSRVITAPSSGADLLIVDLATNGSAIQADEVVVQ